MSIFDSGYDDLKDHARRNGVSESPEEVETGFVENFSPSLEYFKQQMISTSEQHMIGDQVNDAMVLFNSLGPNKKDDRLKKLKLGGKRVKGLGGVTHGKQFLEDNHQAILDLQAQYPDAGLKTIDDIMKDAQEKARLTREKMAKTNATASGLGTVGTIAGGIVGAFHDPILVGSMLLGSGKITGPSKAVNAWKAFKTEAAIGAGAELLITPSVMSWRDKLEDPYSLKEATINILTVAGFAGVSRAAGSYVVDVFEARKAIKSLRASGEDGKADVVESYVDLHAEGTLADQDGHIRAYLKAQEALERGAIPKQADLDEITGTTGIEKLEPEEIFVDAETYQFKKSDEEGVTDRLEGVKEWDPYQAGIVMVFEDAAGKRFIVDGHQRLALAKRLGKDQDGIELNAFVIREKDGFTPASAREIAARVNISQGTGTALDAAKVLRAASETGDGFIDTLPPNSALVRNARGLANLDDVSFRMVIDEMIDEKYGAIVGELISDAAAQAAVIRALVKAKPSNVNQARFMINDMKAAGFTKTKTQDLFGGHTVTESLFKERAKVIDSAMKKIKKDKSIFKTLAEQESRIAGAGNKLDRDANLLRLSDDEKTLAALTSLANAKGPVSDAINDAARRVKSGESIQRATRDILPELRRSGKSELNARSSDDGAGDGDAALKTLKELEAENKSTAPKIPTENVFKNKLGVIPKEKRKKVDSIINAGKEKDIEYRSIDIESIVPTQKNITIPNLRKVQEAKNIDEDIIAVEHNGKNYLVDGHHRVANAILANEKTIDARVFGATKPKEKVVTPVKPKKLNDQLKDSGLDLDDPYLNELHATELKQIDDLLAKHGDMEIPTGARLDADGKEVIEFRSAKEVMQELDDEQKVIDDMFKCIGE